MGLFADLFKKHEKKEDPVIRELLEALRIAEKIELFQAQEIERLTKELQRLLHPAKPHPIRFDVFFP